MPNESAPMARADLASVSQMLRDYRRKTKRKQEHIAETLGLSQGYYSRLENGRMLPSLTVYQRIMDMLSDPRQEPVSARWRKSVQFTHTAASLLYADQKAVRLLEFSKGLRAVDPKYQEMKSGEKLDGVLGEDADLQFFLLRDIGAFSGEVSIVENIWKPNASTDEIYYRALTTVFPDDQYGFVLHSQHNPISEEEYRGLTDDQKLIIIER